MITSKLILDISGFPAKLLNIKDILPSAGLSKQEYVEQRILRAINEYNPKLKLSDIEYLDIKTQFPKVHTGAFTGIIVEDMPIEERHRDNYVDGDYYFYEEAGQLFVRKLKSYVFLSDYDELGRDIIAQSIFPEIVEYMADYIDSPSYTVANHPIYYLNIMNKDITSRLIMMTFALLISADIGCIEVFRKNIDALDVPTDIVDFIRKYKAAYKETADSIITDYYELLHKEKKFVIKTDKLTLGDFLVETPSGYYDFKGSSEKFYWMELYPLSILAVKNAYKIDYKGLEDFCLLANSKFNPRSKKLQRFKIFLDYLKKISLR